MNNLKEKINFVLLMFMGAIAQVICLEMSAIAPAQGQSITSANDAANTIVNPNAGNSNQFDITSGTTSNNGANLFHSFQQFNLNQGEIANFISNPNILNILGRVVGGDPSIINGTIQVSGSSANLYLMNPAGIVFGANASLNVPGDFTATTATGILFNNGIFNAEDSNTYSNLDGDPTGFNFANLQTTGSILNLANLENKNQSLSLIGGTVVSTGNLSAQNGSLIITSVEGGKLLRISQPGNLLSLEIANSQTTSITPRTLAQLLTGSGQDFTVNTNLTVNNEQVSLTDSSIDINTGDVLAPSSVDVVAQPNLEAQNSTLSATQKLIVNSNLSATGNLNLEAANNVLVNGNVTSNGGNISLKGNVLLNSNANFSSTDKDITFNNSVNGGKNLILNAGTGDLTFSGAIGDTTKLTSLTATAANTNVANNISTTGNLTFNNPLSLTGTTQQFSADTGNISLNKIDGASNLTVNANTTNGQISFNDIVGGTTKLNSLTATAANTNVANNISTTGNLTFNNPLSLTGTTQQLSADTGNISFNKIDGASNLTVNANTTNGEISFNDIIGDTTKLNSLTATAANTNVANNISTTGNLTFNNPLSLTGTTQQFSADTGNISFNKIDGASNLTVNANTTNGEISFNDIIGDTTKLTSLTATASQIAIGNNISTTGNQQFNNPVTLTGNATLTSDNNINFANTVDGGQDLTLLATGNINLNNIVGGTTKLTSLTATAANTNVANNISTTGKLTFNNPLSLIGTTQQFSADTGNISFNKIDGASDFTINSNTGNISFNDIVGGTTKLNSLTATASQIEIGNNISTTGNQQFNNPVTLTGNATLTSDNNINFANTVDGAKDLTLSATGNINLNNIVGGTTKLNSLTATASQIAIGNNISTTGNQQFNSPVILTGNATLNSGNNINFDNTVDGGQDLTLLATGNINLNNIVGGTTKLTSLTATAANTNVANNISTTGNQQFNNPVTLTGNATLTSGNNINFGNTVDGGKDLTLSATGNINLNNIVGGNTKLNSLTATAANTNVANDITTTGNQQFNSPVTLTANATFNAETGTININNGLTAGSNNFNLTANEINLPTTANSVTGSGNVVLQPFTTNQNIILGGANDSGADTLDLTTTDLAALKNGFNSITIGSNNGSGLININPVNFFNPVTIQSPNGNINVNGLITGTDITLNGNLTTLNAGITASNITFPKEVVLGTGANVPLNAANGKIDFNSKVDGNGNLTLATGTGNINFGAAVGSTNPLNSLTITNAASTNISGNITTNDNININSPVTLTGNGSQVFNAGNGNITVNNTLAAGNNNFTAIANQLIFGGDITAVNNAGITLEANQNITTNNITTQSGDIKATTENGAIATGNLTVKNNAAITLEANQNVTTGDMTTEGGDIKATSTIGAIATGNLESNIDSNGNGGNVTIEAKDRITTGNINTSSSNGNGGSVKLDPDNDITVTWINAQGGTNGIGGNVDIKTKRYFQATGTFLINNGYNASISTVGGAGGGSIAIDHGGDSVTPFFVGRSSINGTAGVITSSLINSILPVESFPDSATRGKIQIITQGRVVPGKNEFLVAPLPENKTTTTTSNIADIERNETQRIAQLLNLGDVRSKTEDEIRTEMQTIQQTTTAIPGIVYVEFARENYTVNAANSTLKDEPKDSDPLVLTLLTTDGKPPIRRIIKGVTRGNIQKVADEFYQEVSLKESNESPLDQEKLSTTSYKKSAKQLYEWLIAPLETEFKTQGLNNLLFIMPDARLRSLPIAALMDNQDRFLIEKYSLAMAPTFSLVNSKYSTVKNLQVLAMGADSFDPGPDRKRQVTALLGAPIEAETIVKQVWLGKGKALINQEFTLQRLQDERKTTPFGIIHLATHAIFTPENPNNSFIRLYNSELKLDDISQLKLNNPQVELLVLSACETAYADENSQLGLAGSAVKIGVKSVVASLWQVSDAGTLGLMTEFHRQLQTQNIKAEALRQAQIAMIQNKVTIDPEGNNLMIGSNGLSIPLTKISVSPEEAKLLNLKHPFFWAPFTIIGSPW